MAVGLGCLHPPLSQLPPQLSNADSIGRKHTILQTVQVPSMNGRYKLAGRKTEEDAWREVVLSYAVTELEVGVEHGTEG